MFSKLARVFLIGMLTLGLLFSAPVLAEYGDTGSDEDDDDQGQQHGDGETLIINTIDSLSGIESVEFFLKEKKSGEITYQIIPDSQLIERVPEGQSILNVDFEYLYITKDQVSFDIVFRLKKENVEKYSGLKIFVLTEDEDTREVKMTRIDDDSQSNSLYYIVNVGGFDQLSIVGVNPIEKVIVEEKEDPNWLLIALLISIIILLLINIGLMIRRNSQQNKEEKEIKKENKKNKKTRGESEQGKSHSENNQTENNTESEDPYYSNYNQNSDYNNQTYY